MYSKKCFHEPNANSRTPPYTIISRSSHQHSAHLMPQACHLSPTGLFRVLSTYLGIMICVPKGYI